MIDIVNLEGPITEVDFKCFINNAFWLVTVGCDPPTTKAATMWMVEFEVDLLLLTSFYILLLSPFVMQFFTKICHYCQPIYKKRVDNSKFTANLTTNVGGKDSVAMVQRSPNYHGGPAGVRSVVHNILLHNYNKCLHIKASIHLIANTWLFLYFLKSS